LPLLPLILGIVGGGFASTAAFSAPICLLISTVWACSAGVERVVGMPLASTRSPGTAGPPWAKEAVPMSRVIAAAERADFTCIILEHLRLEKIVSLSAQLVAGKGRPESRPRTNVSP